MGGRHVTVSELNIGHKTLIPLDQYALYEPGPFQNGPIVPSIIDDQSELSLSASPNTSACFFANPSCRRLIDLLP